MRDGQSWIRTYLSHQVNIVARSILISAGCREQFFFHLEPKKSVKNGILSFKHEDNIYNMHVFFRLVLLQTSLGRFRVTPSFWQQNGSLRMTSAS